MSEQQPRKAKAEIEYRVKREFKYNGEMMKPGQEFVPAGSPNDWKIINQGRLVERVETLSGTPRRNKKRAK